MDSSSSDGGSSGGGDGDGGSRGADDTPPILRHQLGKQLSNITDIINDNLIIVRYSTISTVLLLGAYGVANTPLFYRCTSIMDIPQKMFYKRKWLHGRLVATVATPSPSTTSNTLKMQSSNAEGALPMVVLFRHSSPMERLLTQSAFNKLLSFTGKSSSPGLLYTSANPSRNLLPIEVAGIHAPPICHGGVLSVEGNQFPLIDKLIEQKTKVSLQLLAQRVVSDTPTQQQNDHDVNSSSIQNTAICHIHYKQPKQWFTTTNVGLEMIKYGEALTSGVVVPLSDIDKDSGSIEAKESSAQIIDYHPTIKQLQDDTKFISQLEEAEYTSWKSRMGIWSSDDMRKLKSEYIEEEEEENSSWSLCSMIKKFIRR